MVERYLHVDDCDCFVSLKSSYGDESMRPKCYTFKW